MLTLEEATRRYRAASPERVSCPPLLWTSMCVSWRRALQVLVTTGISVVCLNLWQWRDRHMTAFVTPSPGRPLKGGLAGAAKIRAFAIAFPISFMTQAAAGSKTPDLFELKSASLSLLSCVLKTADPAALDRELSAKLGETPDAEQATGSEPTLLELLGGEFVWSPHPYESIARADAC